MTEIGESAFFQCPKAKVTAPKLVTLGAYVFYYSNGSFEIAESVTTIDDDAFQGTEESFKVTNKSSNFVLMSGVLYSKAMDKVYRGFNALLGEGVVVLPTTVTEIGGFVFRNCAALKSINLSHVTRIKDNAFQYCEGLSSVTLDSVREIEDSAFEGCTGLRSMTLGSSSNDSDISVDRNFIDAESAKDVDLVINTYIAGGRAYDNELRISTTYITFNSITENY